MTEYRLVTASGRLLGTMTGYPEAMLAARALAHVEPVAIEGWCEPRSVFEWERHIEAARRLVEPA